MSDDAKVSLGKGRPTPKRSEAQKRRGGPVPPPPTTRREAAQRLRAERAQARKDGRGGSGRGDGGRVLARDAGPVRALVRDVVDARRNVAVVMLPIALVLVVAQLVASKAVLSVAVSLWTATLLIVAVDLVLIGVHVRRAVHAHFPQEKARSHISYGLLRSTVLRRFRMPAPRVQPPALFRR